MLAFGEGPMVPGLMQLYMVNFCLCSSWALARAVQLPWLGIVIEKHPQAMARGLLALGSAVSWCVNHLAAEHGRAAALPACVCQTSATGQQGKQYVAKSLAPFSLASQVSGWIPASLGMESRWFCCLAVLHVRLKASWNHVVEGGRCNSIV